MSKIKTYNLFLESNRENYIDIYEFANSLKGWQPYPSLSLVKKLSDRIIGPGIYDRVEKMVDDIFGKLEDVDMEHIRDALNDVFDEFLDKSNRFNLCVLYCDSVRIKYPIDRRFNGSMSVRDINSSRTYIICHILLNMINPTISFGYPSTLIRETDEQIYVTDPKWNCVNFNIDNYEISKKVGQHLPADPGDYKKRSVYISPLDINKLRKYNIEDFFECYRPGIYIEIYDSDEYHRKFPLKKIENLFDEYLPNILHGLEYEEILWDLYRKEDRDPSYNNHELYDYTLKILLK